jgi:hypothetical protein
MSSILGALVGVVLIAIKGKDMKYAVPFGAFPENVKFPSSFPPNNPKKNAEEL